MILVIGSIIALFGVIAGEPVTAAIGSVLLGIGIMAIGDTKRA